MHPYAACPINRPAVRRNRLPRDHVSIGTPNPPNLQLKRPSCLPKRFAGANCKDSPKSPTVSMSSVWVPDASICNPPFLYSPIPPPKDYTGCYREELKNDGGRPQRSVVPRRKKSAPSTAATAKDPAATRTVSSCGTPLLSPRPTDRHSRGLLGSHATLLPRTGPGPPSGSDPPLRQ